MVYVREGLERGKVMRKWCNYIIISKNKINNKKGKMVLLLGLELHLSMSIRSTI